MQLVRALAGCLSPARRLLLVVVGVISVVVVGWLWWYLASPGRVVRLALGALERRDAEAIVALGGADEKRIMNVTPATVRAALNQTWWRDRTRLPTSKLISKTARFADQLEYGVRVVPVPGRPTQVMYLHVYRERGDRWRLCITPLLYGATKAALGIECDHAPTWDAVARRAGVRGVMGPDGRARWNDGRHEQLHSLSHD